MTRKASDKAREFFEHVLARGGQAELALIFDAEAGWRVALHCWPKALMLRHADARRLAESCLAQMAREPERAIGAGLTFEDIAAVKEWFSEIVAAAEDCRRKRRAGEVPDGYAEAMPVVGRA